jgi:hypothetical protein
MKNGVGWESSASRLEARREAALLREIPVSRASRLPRSAQVSGTGLVVTAGTGNGNIERLAHRRGEQER